MIKFNQGYRANRKVLASTPIGAWKLAELPSLSKKSYTPNSLSTDLFSIVRACVLSSRSPLRQIEVAGLGWSPFREPSTLLTHPSLPGLQRVDIAVTLASARRKSPIDTKRSSQSEPEKWILKRHEKRIFCNEYVCDGCYKIIH